MSRKPVLQKRLKLFMFACGIGIVCNVSILSNSVLKPYGQKLFYNLSFFSAALRHCAPDDFWANCRNGSDGVNVTTVDSRSIASMVTVSSLLPKIAPSMKSSNLSTRSHSGKKLLCKDFTARLGNEMFQYASTLGLALTLNRTPVFIDSKFLPTILKSFKTSLPVSLDLKARCDKSKILMEDCAYKYNHKFTQINPEFDYTIALYLQSYKYFEKHETYIREALTFSDEIRNQSNIVVQELRRLYNSSTLVAVHLRRGDLAYEENSKLGYPDVSPQFVNRSVQFFLRLFPDSVFVISSDSPEWWQEHFPKGYRVHFLKPHSPAEDMTILASLDHSITSFGTYSWWVGFLNPGIKVYMKDFIIANTLIGDCFNPRGADFVHPSWIPL